MKMNYPGWWNRSWERMTWTMMALLTTMSLYRHRGKPHNHPLLQTQHEQDSSVNEDVVHIVVHESRLYHAISLGHFKTCRKECGHSFVPTPSGFKANQHVLIIGYCLTSFPDHCWIFSCSHGDYLSDLGMRLYWLAATTVSLAPPA